MFGETAVTGIFGSWWGAFEFTLLVVFISIISYIGMKIVQNNFTPDERSGVIHIRKPAKIEKAVFGNIAAAIDDSAAVRKDPKKKRNLKNGLEPASKKLAKNIERISSEELKRVTDVQDPKLLHSIMKRTARQIGYDIGDDISPQSAPDRDGSSSSSLLPIRMINIRTEELLEKGGKDTIVRIHILDGILPDNVPLPFKAEIKVDLVDEKYEGEDGGGSSDSGPSLFETFPEFVPAGWPPITNDPNAFSRNNGNKQQAVFKHVEVNSLADGITLSTKGSIFNTGNRLKISIVTEDKNKTVLFDSQVTISSPIPKITEVFACRNVALMRLDMPKAINYDNVEYTPDTLNEKYVSDYPANFPRLSRQAEIASNLAAKLPRENQLSDINKPSVSFVYSKTNTVNTPVLNKVLYNETLKNMEGNESEGYKILNATEITHLRNPSNPARTFICVSVPESEIEAQWKMLGWIVGFKTSSDVLTTSSGYNIVFPASKVTQSDKLFSVISTDVNANTNKVVVHNTPSRVGCFGSSVNFRVDAATAPDWPGPTNGPDFFSYQLRPCIILKTDNDNREPRITAVLSSPATEYAGERTTSLLPRALNVSVGPLTEVRGGDIITPVQTALLGGEQPTFKAPAEPTKLYAVFPVLDSHNGLVKASDNPFQPIHSITSRNKTTVLSVSDVIVNDDDDDDVVLEDKSYHITVSDPVSGSILAKENVLSSRITSRPIFIDGARDDRVFSVKMEVFGGDDKGIQMPFTMDGHFEGQFSDMSVPSNELAIWNDPSTFTAPVRDTPATDITNKGIVYCRTTLPPISNRGIRDPFMKQTSLVPLPTSIPEWAFADYGGEIKYPRHIFISSIRTNDTTNIVNTDTQTEFSIENWLREQIDKEQERHRQLLPAPSEAYTQGEKVYAKMYMGDGVSEETLDQIVHTSNTTYVVDESGTKKENLLVNKEDKKLAAILGKWGIVVFGANKYPDEPADRYTNWRNTGRLRAVGSYSQLRQPVAPLQTRLATWPSGDPVTRLADGQFLVRLDPRCGGIGSANGFYNNNGANNEFTSSLLFAIVGNQDKVVSYAERVRFYMKIVARNEGKKHLKNDDGLVLVDRNSALHRRLWNRTTFDHDDIVLCVKIPQNVMSKIEPGTSSGVLVDPLVFANVASSTDREEFYKKFIDTSSGPVVIDRASVTSSYNISVPLNFYTTCGFIVG
ncbi:wsv216 [White spot syndrome virus]|uniref:Wsv216 n=1 Tax=White spot syndrome virus TaxID=342409 RepID=A0A1Z2R9G2_9VIRU|nr:wsv216 [White spot syndrome virus]QVW09819.1 MAG: hypothetical protein OJPGDAPP_00051 [White spot syndrome virus]QVW09932.1 MAG: hypothetical protein EDAONDGI_00017 [White spot syndrome virus]WOG35270.1 envelope protein [White spot syndrome virus]BDX26354.1 MAG: envelope protein VP124 [White spot syndrome virus]